MSEKRIIAAHSMSIRDLAFVIGSESNLEDRFNMEEMLAFILLAPKGDWGTDPWSEQVIHNHSFILASPSFSTQMCRL